MPHKGGLRLQVDSPDYQILAEWLVAGAAPPRPDDPKLDRLEVLPASVRLTVGQSQPLIVRARYSDGRVEDVTDWAKYTSTQEPVAQVDADGVVKNVGYGEGAISVWFSSQIVVAHITSPYPYNIPADTFAQTPRANFIDDIVLENWKPLSSARPRVPQTPFTSACLSRYHWSLRPRSPRPPATYQTIGPISVQRLSRRLVVATRVCRLLDLPLERRPGHNGRRIRPPAVKAYYAWLRGHVERNTPWDQLVPRDRHGSRQ